MSETAGIVVADSDDIALARQLFTEYLEATIRETGLPNPTESPEVLEAMRADIDALPAPYVPPAGAILLARSGGEPAGSVGLARFDDGSAELKRLWVRPAFRRRGVARALTIAGIERVAALGYARLVLDVVPSRTGAIDLYRSLGFTDIEPYARYPFPMVFLGRRLVTPGS